MGLFKVSSSRKFAIPPKTKMLPFEDSQGRVFIEAVAHGTLTALTPYKIIANEYGWVTAALADETVYCYIGVPLKAYASDDIAIMQIGGPVDDVVTPSISMTVGYALEVHDGAVALVSSDYNGGDASFAVGRVASTTSTTQDIILIPRQILTST